MAVSFGGQLLAGISVGSAVPAAGPLRHVAEIHVLADKNVSGRTRALRNVHPCAMYLIKIDEAGS